MRSFEKLNPITLTVYFFSVAGISTFCSHPAILALSLLGSLSFCIARGSRGRVGLHVGMAVIFLISALINPIFSHRGDTVLFFVNDTPITLEVSVYGLVAASAVVSMLYWFYSYNALMSSDKILYLCARLSPKIAMILSTAMRYVSLLFAQSKKIRAAQKATGEYGDGNIFARIGGEIKVFSSLVSFAIEGGIISADSMAARGYGSSKRGRMKRFSFGSDDAALVIVTLLLLLTVIISAIFGALGAQFYPRIDFSYKGAASLIGYSAYGILAFIPTFVEIKERVRWKYLRSRI